MLNTNSHKRKKMLVICPFPQGVAPGQRLKYEQYFDDWRNDGWQIDVSSFMDDEMWAVVFKEGYIFQKIIGVIRGHFRRLRDVFSIKKYDLIYICMWVTPFGTSIMERLVRALSKRVIYDVEDNLLSKEKPSKKNNPNKFIQFFKGKEKIRYLICEADHVITASPFLNDMYLDINKNMACTCISSSVNTDRFIPLKESLNKKEVVIGWTGTFSTKIFIESLESIFIKLAERVDFKLIVIGNFEYQIEGINLETIQWTSENEVLDLQALDIGVYPLSLDDWVLGKSGIKAIQYMSVGIPTVATNVSTTPMVINDGVNGILVRTDEEWLDALEALVKDADLRRRMGIEARKSAVEKFSIKAIAREYRQVIDSVMSKNT